MSLERDIVWQCIHTAAKKSGKFVPLDEIEHSLNDCLTTTEIQEALTELMRNGVVAQSSNTYAVREARNLPPLDELKRHLCNKQEAESKKATRTKIWSFMRWAIPTVIATVGLIFVVLTYFRS